MKNSLTKEQQEALDAFKESTTAVLEYGIIQNDINNLERENQETPKNKDANNKKIASLKKKPKPDLNQPYKDKVKLAIAFGYKDKNPGLEPSQKELEEMSQLILDQRLDLNDKQRSFLTNSAYTPAPVKEADISLTDPAKLSPETIDRINTLLDVSDTKKTEGLSDIERDAVATKQAINAYNAAQLMQGKPEGEFQYGSSPTDEESKEANKVLREFQKAVDEVAPPMKIMGEKHKQHDNLRDMAKAIGKKLRAESLKSRVAKIAKSMVRTARNSLSSITSIPAASVVRAPRKKLDKGQTR